MLLLFSLGYTEVMKSVYVFGPIYISGNDYLPIYKKLNKLSEKYFEIVIGTYPDFWDSNESPRQFWDRTYETITKCDLFIAECSSPSHGVGMEPNGTGTQHTCNYFSKR